MGVKTHVLSVVTEYQNINTNEATGTIKNVLSQTKSFLPLLDAYVQQGNKSSASSGGASKAELKAIEKRLKEAEAEAKNAKKKMAEAQAQLQAVTTERDNAVRQVTVMGDKQMKLATANIEMEEELAKVKKLK